MVNFLVVGRVAAHIEEPGKFEIGEVTVGTDPPLPIRRGPRADMTGVGGASIIRAPSELKIDTNLSFWCYQLAETPQEAMKAVEFHQVPMLVHALSRVFGRVVEVEPTWAYFPNGSGEGGINRRVSFMIIETVAAPAGIDAAADDYHAVEADPRARAACRFLARARELAAAQPDLGDVAADAAVVEYMKALELLANDERCRRRVEGREEQQEAIVAKMRAKLDRVKSPKQMASAVHSAADELRRIDRKFLDARVVSMSDVLDLSDDWLRIARRLLKARNAKAAHPGDVLAADERALILYGTTSDVRQWDNSADWMICEAIAALARA